MSSGLMVMGTMRALFFIWLQNILKHNFKRNKTVLLLITRIEDEKSD